MAGLPDAVVGIAPHSLRAVTGEELTAILPLAGAGPIHIHIAEQRREGDACLAWSGQRPVEWLLNHAGVDARWCLVHATHVTQAELVRVAASGAVVGLCPITEANLGDGVFPAVAYSAEGGRWGVGSDSNVLIDAAEELRMLEYSQRLTGQSRNALATAPGDSSGAILRSAAAGGAARALGAGGRGLAEGECADIVTLDTSLPSFLGRNGDRILDSWIFGARERAIDCVWVGGAKVVSSGRHHARDRVARRYAIALARLLD